MKFTCNQSDFRNDLSLVSPLVPSRPNHPILANVLLKADTENQRVELTSFDLRLGLCTGFPADIESGGVLAIPPKLLKDIVSHLPKGKITIDSEADGFLLTLTSQGGEYKVQGVNAEDFPAFPEIKNRQPMSFPAEILAEGLHGALFAASVDETRQALTGLHIIVQPGTLEFVATDGHRLAIVEIENPSSSQEESFEVTIPAKALRELGRIIGRRQGQSKDKPLSLTIHLDSGQVAFELPNQRLISRTLEGKYPEYRHFIPTQFEHRVNIERKPLLKALERIAILASQKRDTINFSIDQENQQVLLSVEKQDMGNAMEALNAQVSGNSLDIAFNVKYVMESLKNISSDEIQIQFNSNTTPAVISPLSGAKITHLLMPIKMRK